MCCKMHETECTESLNTKMSCLTDLDALWDGRDACWRRHVGVVGVAGVADVAVAGFLIRSLRAEEPDQVIAELGARKNVKKEINPTVTEVTMLCDVIQQPKRAHIFWRLREIHVHIHEIIDLGGGGQKEKDEANAQKSGGHLRILRFICLHIQILWPIANLVNDDTVHS